MATNASRNLSLSALLVLLALGGCAHAPTFGAVNYGLCDDPRTKEKGDGILRPIGWVDEDTDETIREIKSHNAVVDKLCP